MVAARCERAAEAEDNNAAQLAPAMALAAAAGGEALKALVKAPVLPVVLRSLLLTVERGVHVLALLEVPALAERVPVPIAAAQEVFYSWL